MRKTYLLTFLLAAGLMAESPFAAYAKDSPLTLPEFMEICQQEQFNFSRVITLPGEETGSEKTGGDQKQYETHYKNDIIGTWSKIPGKPVRSWIPEFEKR